MSSAAMTAWQASTLMLFAMLGTAGSATQAQPSSSNATLNSNTGELAHKQCFGLLKLIDQGCNHCGDGRWANATAQRCQICTMCNGDDGHVAVVACTKHADTVCQRCPGGTTAKPGKHNGAETAELQGAFAKDGRCAPCKICPRGFSQNSTCLPDADRTCTKTDCGGEMPEVKFADVVLDKAGDSAYRATATVRCITGYEGGGRIECKADGQWTSPPQCSAPNLKCDPGNEPLGGKCSVCTGNTISWDGVKCRPCPVGSTAKNDRFWGTPTTCDGLAGWYPTNEKNADYERCSLDTYKPDVSNFKCGACNAEQVTLAVGSNSSSDCVCQAGYYGRRDGFIVCFDNEFDPNVELAYSKKFAGAIDCYNCDLLSCAVCETDGGAPRPMKGWAVWKPADGSDSDIFSLGTHWHYFRCPYARSCQHSTPGMCSNHSSGPLCAVCDKEYYRDGVAGDCLACASHSVGEMIEFVTIIAFGSLLFTVFFAVLSCRVKLIKLDSTLVSILTCSARITISYFQVVTELGSTLDISYRRVLPSFEYVLSLIRPLFLDVSDLLSWQCWGGFYALLWTRVLAMPLCLLALVFVRFRCFTPRGKPDKYNARKQLLIFTFLLYPKVSHWLFSYFICRQLGPSAKDDYLEADYSISCGSSSYTLTQIPVIVLIVLIPVGIPSSLYMVMMWSRARSARLFEQLPAADVSEILTADARFAVFAHGRMLRQGGLRSLVKFYRPECFYFELIDWTRKVVLTGLLLFANRGTLGQTFFGVFLTIGFLSLTIWLRPYAATRNNVLHFLTQAGETILMLVSLALRAGGPGAVDKLAENTNPFDKLMVGVIALVVGAGVPLILLSEAIFALGTAFKEKYAADKEMGQFFQSPARISEAGNKLRMSVNSRVGDSVQLELGSTPTIAPRELEMRTIERHGGGKSPGGRFAVAKQKALMFTPHKLSSKPKEPQEEPEPEPPSQQQATLDLNDSDEDDGWMDGADGAAAEWGGDEVINRERTSSKIYPEDDEMMSP